ncbi:hypothetical protein [Flavobacterium sp. WC2409]|uniref:Uncharacterized protein n=2 Tax=unclassified Flavobacterium TaxID=196869 RepID=A0AB39WAW7_9FLAO
MIAKRNIPKNKGLTCFFFAGFFARIATLIPRKRIVNSVLIYVKYSFAKQLQLFCKQKSIVLQRFNYFFFAAFFAKQQTLIK